ncbi:hypothetical protein BU24DRAFT_422988 [Aaosphaeria arxii CBS 175.79]|uniref:Uncharacterized protein n=1 Tax=Aaosphaeria arxii CBS 175.79 TaxID=1450172 RepID=A0A6A5XV68_9PLEO|nr:uncharacterized protein BU24DRAFT_422988 [Aaosphaeria arxii CBS 175.79]KAF2016611.1 hypothetical protein BU24DRAFT_422988 [Aaosphaeria arxii CBS 175.79]
MADDDRPFTPRRSRFQEGTMNSMNSIHPPPEELWVELGIEDIIRRANEDSQRANPRKRSAPDSSTDDGDVVTAITTSESSQSLQSNHQNIFERFSRAASSFFRGNGFSTLGKRKAGERDAVKEASSLKKASSAERELLKVADKENINTPARESRKEEYERAYAEAKEKGLLPKPQVFVRPRATPRGTPRPASARKENSNGPETPMPASTLRASASKKDLAKQVKLSKRVSDLEQKLAVARKQLHDAIGEPMPTLPTLPPTPNTATTSRSQKIFTPVPVPVDTPSTAPIKENLDSEDNSSSAAATTTDSGSVYAAAAPAPKRTPSSAGKIVKKRKASTSHGYDSSGEYRPIPTESDYDESDLSEKKTPNKRRRNRGGGRLTKKRSGVKPRQQQDSDVVMADGSDGAAAGDVDDRSRESSVVMIVPDGVVVPPIPSIPKDVQGKRAQIKETDGFGGYGHEIF